MGHHMHFGAMPMRDNNGVLGNFPNNQKNIEPQLMKKCLLLQELHSKSFPTEGEVFQNILLQNSHCLTGGLMMHLML